MTVYLFKFSICLAIFLAFYKFFLEQQSMHVFKRFYLLGALIIALSIPLITFTTYVEPVSATFTEIELPLQIADTSISPHEAISIPDTNYWFIILWSIYGLGVLIFSIQFIRNLHLLINKINHNTKRINSNITNVLLKEDITPHTFLRYIFFNKQKFEANVIPQEVFWHEETHAIQKHSLDILFIELFQIVFWFNPFIYFIKKAMKLNHEFLADQGVLNKGILPSTYQQLLLEFSSHQQEHQLTNAINYSLIKKRFTIMKTQTSKRTFWFRSFILLPILAFTFYSFSNKVEIEKSSANNTINEKQKIILLVDGQNIYLNHQLVNLSDFVRVFNDMTDKWSESDFQHYYLDIKTEDVSDEFIEKINEAYRKTNLSLRANRDNDYIIYNEKPPTPILPSFYSDVPPPSKPIEHINHMQKRGATFIFNGNKISADKAILLFKNEQSLRINTIMDDPRPPVVKLTESSQDKATPAQVKEYNKLAKHYNNLSGDKLIIKLKDMARIRELYDLMSESQKKNAEPLPNFPPPPPPTKNEPKQNDYLLKGIAYPAPLPDNATPKQKREYAKAVEDYKSQGYGYKYQDKGKEITVIINDVAPPPPPVIKRPPPPPVKNEEKIKELKEKEKALAKLIKEKSKQDKKLNEKELEELHDNFRKKREEIEAKKQELHHESLKSRKERSELLNQREALILEERKAYEKQKKAVQQERKKLIKEKREKLEKKEREQLIKEHKIKELKIKEHKIKEHKIKEEKIKKEKEEEEYEVLVFEEPEPKKKEQIIKEHRSKQKNKKKDSESEEALLIKETKTPLNNLSHQDSNNIDIKKLLESGDFEFVANWLYFNNERVNLFSNLGYLKINTSKKSLDVSLPTRNNLPVKNDLTSQILIRDSESFNRTRRTVSAFSEENSLNTNYDINASLGFKFNNNIKDYKVDTNDKKNTVNISFHTLDNRNNRKIYFKMSVSSSGIAYLSMYSNKFRNLTYKGRIVFTNPNLSL